MKALAQYCNFGASSTDLLRDCIVCGINDDHVQRRLLSEKALTFEKVLELAVSLETAKKNVSELQGTAMPQAVHRITNHVCYHCERGGHQPDECRFKQAKCLSCSKVGHIQIVCRIAQKPDKTTSRKARDYKPQPIKQLSEKEEESVELMLKHLCEDNNAN